MSERFHIGEIVRFPGGSVDWEVTEVHDTHLGFQRLVLQSGMSDRMKFTSSLRVTKTAHAVNVPETAQTTSFPNRKESSNV